MVSADPLVPSLTIFGDSVADVGNNNDLITLIRANFPPYGRDFADHRPTGRFSNGKLAIDITVNTIRSIQNPLPTTRVIGIQRLMTLTNTDLKWSVLTRNVVMRQNLYGLGARRIGVTTLPPTGCLPASITLFGLGSNECVEKLNWDATSFNQKLNTTSQSLVEGLPGLKLVVFDVYNPLLNMIKKPSDSGFMEARKACCGTGVLETAFMCNAMSPGTCSNASEYVFWDGFHPSEAANNVLAQALLSQGSSLVS
ncbi:GDSL esterase/lipase At5g03810 [Linum perenne]